MNKTKLLLFFCLTVVAVILTGCSINSFQKDKQNTASGKASGSESEDICQICGKIPDDNRNVLLTGEDFTLEEVFVGNEEGKLGGAFICNKCGRRVTGNLTSDNIGMPILYLNGDIDGISKENRKTVQVRYSSPNNKFEADAVIKVQGSSSAYYPKKNFNITFYETGTNDKYKTELSEGWGKESKYCLKANYIDASQARNIVSAKIYGEIAHDRDRADELDSLVNAGAIDGFPVLLCLNGSPYGLYTLNIPKDNWLFGMKKGDDRQAMLFANDWSDSTALNRKIGSNPAADGWKLEFCSSEDNTSVGTEWVFDSFNNFIGFLKDNKGETFKNGLDQYLDIERAIDVLIFIQFIYGLDNSSKNMLWVTYDGIKWVPSVYDLDSTWGLRYDGQEYYAPDSSANFVNDKAIWTKLYGYYSKSICERYFYLRENILSENHINEIFLTFFNKIPDALYIMDGKLWPDMPNQETNNYNTIQSWISDRIIYMDSYMNKKNKGEK